MTDTDPLVLINAFEVPADADEAATQSEGFREAAHGLASFRPHPALYEAIRT
jgi:hypothetical protein